MPAGFGWTRPLPSTSRTTEPTPNVGSAAAVVASRQLSCRRWCCLSPDPVEKVLEQLVQKNGISPVWTRVCSSRSRFDLEKIAKTHRMWIIQGFKGTAENKAIKLKAEGWKCKHMKYFLQWARRDGTNENEKTKSYKSAKNGFILNERVKILSKKSRLCLLQCNCQYTASMGNRPKSSTTIDQTTIGRRKKNGSRMLRSLLGYTKNSPQGRCWCWTVGA